MYNVDNKIDYLYYVKQDKNDVKLASSTKLYSYHSNGKLNNVMPPVIAVVVFK